jgi:hypothetical protein
MAADAGTADVGSPVDSSYVHAGHDIGGRHVDRDGGVFEPVVGDVRFDEAT